MISWKMMALAAILALGVGSVGVVHGAFAANQTGNGVIGQRGSGEVTHYQGNQGTLNNKGNACGGPHDHC